MGVARLLTLGYTKDFFRGANMPIPGNLESEYSYLPVNPEAWSISTEARN